MELQEFNPRNIPKGSFSLVVGKRRTGKTTTIKTLLKYLDSKYYEHDSIQVNCIKLRESDYSDLTHSHTNCVISSTTSTKLSLFVHDRQYQNCIIALEDNFFLERSDLKYIVELKKTNIGCVAAAQFFNKNMLEKGLSPDYTFFLKDSNLSSRKRLHDYYTLFWNDIVFEDFCELFNTYTQCPCHSLVIDNNTGELFWFNGSEYRRNLIPYLKAVIRLKIWVKRFKEIYYADGGKGMYTAQTRFLGGYKEIT